jgi:hypothetical protein
MLPLIKAIDGGRGWVLGREFLGSLW